MRSTRSSSAICLTVMPRRSFTRRRTSPLSARNAVRAGPAAVGERRGQPEPRPGRGSGSARTPASRCNRAPRRSPARRASAASTGSTAAATAGSTTCCTSSPSPGPTTTRTRGSTWRARRPKARPRRERCAASSGTWRAASTTCSPLPAETPTRSKQWARRPRQPTLTGSKHRRRRAHTHALPRLEPLTSGDQLTYERARRRLLVRRGSSRLPARRQVSFRELDDPGCVGSLASRRLDRCFDQPLLRWPAARDDGVGALARSRIACPRTPSCSSGATASRTRRRVCPSFGRSGSGRGGSRRDRVGE
jgi:hypothetical protein